MVSGDHRGRRALIVAVAAAVALAFGFYAGRHAAPKALPLAPGERLADTETVVVAVRALARLESVAFHMQRVIDLQDTQSVMFGMVQATDAILLIAAGDVIAGVDLAKIEAGDIVVDIEARRIELRLPAPEVLSVRLDNERTYVHTRKTDLLAKRVEAIETRARQLAEESIRQAALDAQILGRAKQSAEHTLSALLRSLGYAHVQITWASGSLLPTGER